MKNVNVKFKVATNSNTYYATSLRAASTFCKKNDLVITYWYSYLPFTCEKKSAVKVGRGVYCIPDNK